MARFANEFHSPEVNGMKQTDLRILQHLRHNARASLTGISRKTGIPVSTIFDRIRSHEQTMVKKFTALLDFAKLGYPVRTNIFLKVDPQHRDGVRTHLLEHNNINNIFRINNGYDYAIEAVFASIKEVEEFLEDLEAQFRITDKEVYHIIDDIAREKALMPQAN
jgi:DNA-binding Lrp family transcriptional regulator